MFSPFPDRLRPLAERYGLVVTIVATALATLLSLVFTPASAQDAQRTLRVCGDPDNLPFSHENETGFENRIARLVADDLHAALQYDWLPQRRGYVRKSMGQGYCDLFIGVPAGLDRLLTTRPYYRSSYVFVYRKDEAPFKGFDDPRLVSRPIGVQLVGDDLAATPPGHALTQIGAVNNVVGYTVFGEGPAAQRMLDDIAGKRLDAGLVWGPQAGWFAQHEQPPLEMTLAPKPDTVPVPFEFSIAMGVAKQNRALQQELNAMLDRRQHDIEAILDEYGVPRVAMKARVARAPE